MLEAEMDEHIGYEKYQHSDTPNYSNGVRSTFGQFQVEVPQDRNSTFKPKIVKKRQKDISEIEQKNHKYVSYKDKKEFDSDLKSIYLAVTEAQALENLDKVNEKWEEKYPNSMSSWYQHLDVLTPIFKFSLEVRKVIYTTNAIESLNSTYKKLNSKRTVYPSDKALLKLFYLSTLEVTKKME